MDFDEWEYLSDDGYIDFSEDGEKKNFPGKRNPESKSVFDMDYFICPSPNSSKVTESPRNNPRIPNQLVPLPIQLEPRIRKTPDDDSVKELTGSPIGYSVVPSANTEEIKSPQIGISVEADQDTVSQVFFKMKENEFVDMKMDSPKSGNKGMLPPIDTGALKYEEKAETMEIRTSPRMKIEKEILIEDDESTWEGNNDGFNLWKWSLTGIGAICSFSVAAATICILYFGSQKANKQHQNQKIRFQIYTDDKVRKSRIIFYLILFQS